MTDDLPANQYEDETDAVRAGYIPADSVYCEHGNYVGGWAGGDYLCGYCEDGISQEQLVREYIANANAGELCQLAEHGGYVAAGDYRPLNWRAFCAPVGPCPHWAGTFGPDQLPDHSPEALRLFWGKAGMTTNRSPFPSEETPDHA